MALLKHLLFSFPIFIISFVFCYGSLQEDPLTNIYVHHSPSIDDGETLLKNFNKQSTNVLSFNTFEKRSSLKKVNVNDYGAKANGDSDDSEVFQYSRSPKQSFSSFFFFACTVSIGLVFHIFQAFKKAWDEVCTSGEAILVVPEDNYLLKPIRFSGPCEPNIEVQVILSLKITPVINYSFFMLHL